MACNCSCNNFYFVTSATIVGGQLVLTFNRLPTAIDESKLCFRFSQGITLPSGYATLPVVANVSVNGVTTAIPLWNKFGNVMLGQELVLNNNRAPHCRYVYKNYIGRQASGATTTYHLLVTNIPKITTCCGCN